jgi:hypothetical protein
MIVGCGSGSSEGVYRSAYLFSEAFRTELHLVVSIANMRVCRKKTVNAKLLKLATPHIFRPLSPRPPSLPEMLPRSIRTHRLGTLSNWCHLLSLHLSDHAIVSRSAQQLSRVPLRRQQTSIASSPTRRFSSDFACDLPP